MCMRYSLHHFENNPFFQRVNSSTCQWFYVLSDAGHSLEKRAIRKIRVSVVKEDNFLQQVFFAGKEVDEVSQKIKKNTFAIQKETYMDKVE